MLSPLRNRFGIPGVISVIALVFAMLGGAYAATNNSGSGKATASAKAKKGPRGPRGPAGPAGPAGPQGPAGANGKDGANGLNGLDGEPGKNGTNGTNGANGKSVENSVEPSGANCEVGGSKFVVGSGTPTYACNGKQGIQGEAGEDGETGFTETLTPGKTETGAWGFGVITESQVPPSFFEEPMWVPISFPIPLATELGEGNVHYLNVAGSPSTPACSGSAAEPKADPGHLCIYTAEENEPGKNEAFGFFRFNVNNIVKAGDNTKGAGVSGSTLRILILEKGAFARGTWAVTAP